MPTRTKKSKSKTRVRSFQTGRSLEVECVPCYDEFGSEACLRPAHPVYNDPTNPAKAPLTDYNPFEGKGARMEAAHEAFGKWIKKQYGGLGVFTEYTLNRDENGNYTNMSVMMDWDDWFNGWCSALKFAKII